MMPATARKRSGRRRLAGHVDVAIVGAGSSGGVLAARLSEDPARQVALIEAGPDFPDEATVWPLFVVSGENHWRAPAVSELAALMSHLLGPISTAWPSPLVR